MTDERLGEVGATTQKNRASKQTVNRRPSRPAKNRQVTENRNQTDAIRMELFRQAHMQAALPDIPPIPGYHVCWLTSTNPKDSIAMRKRLGYEAIKPEEMVGFGEFAVGQGGTTDGLVHVNEMVAFKLPLDIYNQYMQHNHHYAPAEQDERLTDTAKRTREVLRAKAGKAPDLGDGYEDDSTLARTASAPVPDFRE